MCAEACLLIPFGVFFGSLEPFFTDVGDVGMGGFVICIWMGMGVVSHCIRLVWHIVQETYSYGEERNVGIVYQSLFSSVRDYSSTQ